MADETKRPTAQDIENARELALLAHLDMSRKKATTLEAWQRQNRSIVALVAVFDYAESCLKAEEEAERVPEVEASEHRCPACGAEEVYAMTPFTVYECGSRDYDQRPGTFTPSSECDARVAASLPTNGPEVEAPEDAGDDGPARRGDVWHNWSSLITAVVVGVRESGGWDVTISGYPGVVKWSQDSVDAVQQSSTWELVRRGTVAPLLHPPTDPEARVRAMWDEEVEAELTGRGVGAWYAHSLSDGTRYRKWDDGWDAIAPDGIVYRPEPSMAAYDYSQTGDTTTEAGRMECSRRLLAHLLREEVGHG